MKCYPCIITQSKPCGSFGYFLFADTPLLFRREHRIAVNLIHINHWEISPAETIAFFRVLLQLCTIIKQDESFEWSQTMSVWCTRVTYGYSLHNVFWRKVLWSFKSKSTVPAVKHDGGSIMLFCCYWSWCIEQSGWNNEEEHYLQQLDSLKLSHSWVFLTRQ